jgi:hypothetical protein
MSTETKVFHVGANGFELGTDRVVIPECNIKAENFLDAAKKLDLFLASKTLSDDIELITPFEKIVFDR